MGVIGLSRGDFMALTLDEFEAVYARWREARESRDRQPWEVMRLQTAMTLQPFVKKRLNVRELLPLPWDSQKPERRRLIDDPKERQRQRDRLKYYLEHGEWPD